MRENLSLSELYPLMEEVIGGGGTFRFYPRGVSMEPMLHAGRDSVELGKADEVAVGDVVFYRRDNGAFVLHRIVGAHGGTYTMCGDHQTVLEYGVRREQILAKLVGYYTGEEYHDLTDAAYLQYKKKMVSRFPFYRKNPKILNFLRKVKHMIKKPNA